MTSALRGLQGPLAAYPNGRQPLIALLEKLGIRAMSMAPTPSFARETPGYQATAPVSLDSLSKPEA